jgi:hypothetical protein
MQSVEVTLLEVWNQAAYMQLSYGGLHSSRTQQGEKESGVDL